MSLDIAGPGSRALRIVVAHSAYQQRGGEDAVVAAEVALLRQHGHVVHEYRRDNSDVKELGLASLALQSVWSTRTTDEVTLLLKDFAPDVLHVHNTVPLISPSIYWAADRANVPVVQTLHNFRLLCPQALLLRNGRICEDCVGKVPWRGAIRGCYRGSVAQSSVLAGMLAAHRAVGTWRDKVTRYIALNEFCRAKFIEGGIPAEKLAVKPNFVDMPPVEEQTRGGFLFVGRLSMEKGIDVLARAIVQAPGIHVRVAGAGQEQYLVDSTARTEVLGLLDAEDVYKEMQTAQALVLPSICHENFPRTLVEAFACSLPVIASRLGALEGLIAEGVTGLLFKAGNSDELAAKLSWAHANPDCMEEMGRNARRVYEEKLTGATNYRLLLDIYLSAIQERQRKAL